MAKVCLTNVNGDALNWLAAMIQHPHWFEEGYMKRYPQDLKMDCGDWYSPVTEPELEPDFEEERISVLWREKQSAWWATHEEPGDEESLGINGDTRLIAQLRCLIDKKIGDDLTVEIPDEIYVQMVAAGDITTN
jgi:hypothetical protein